MPLSSMAIRSSSRTWAARYKFFGNLTVKLLIGAALTLVEFLNEAAD